MAFQKVIRRLNIQPAYTSFTDDFATALQNLFGEKLHSIYMCGSIPRGTAVPGKSDADFTLILVEDPSDGELDSLNELEHAFLGKYSFITKIDTPVSTVSEVFENPYDWGFWIKILCVCLRGKDLGAQIPDFEPSLLLVKGINCETEKVMGDLIERYKEKPDRALERKLIKRLLRALFTLTLQYEDRWIDDFREQSALILKYYPRWKHHIQYLLEGLDSEVDEKEKLVEIANELYRSIMVSLFFHVENIFHRKDRVPQVATWIFNEFIRDRIPGFDFNDIVSVLENRNEKSPPVTFTAMAGTKCVGTVSLFASDLKERMDLGPWLGALYVDECWRGFGVGRQLITYLENKAAELGWERLYLRTEKTADYYRTLGWTEIDHLRDENGLDVTVFTKEL